MELKSFQEVREPGWFKKSSFPRRVVQPWDMDPEWRGFHPFKFSSLSCSDPALATILVQRLAESETATGPFLPALPLRGNSTPN